MSTATATRGLYKRPKREPWGIRPEVRSDGAPYPRFSHWPRYCTHVQDAFKRRIGPPALYAVLYERSEKLDADRRILHNVSLSTLALLVGDYLTRDTGESKTAAEPVPRSTLCYWRDQIRALHLVREWDEDAAAPGAPRTRGDGRQKTSYVINSYNRALDLIAADDAIATPKNRTFWVKDCRPLSTEEAAAWKLDVAVAERMPEAWANNARFYDPAAPMKPLKRTLRPASAAEVERICRELVGNLGIGATTEQAAEILRWAHEEQSEMPAEALAAGMRRAIEADAARQRRQNRNAPISFTVKYFSRDRVRGMAKLWHAEQLRRAAEDAIAARRAAERAAQAATLTNPPPDDA